MGRSGSAGINQTGATIPPYVTLHSQSTLTLSLAFPPTWLHHASTTMPTRYTASRTPTNTSAMRQPRFSPLALIAFVLSALAFQVAALQADLAGVVDWHESLIGQPLVPPRTPSPPSFAPTLNGSQVLVAITESNVLAALGENGQIAWRQLFENDDKLLSYHVNGNDVVLLSGPGGSTARAFDLSTGTLRWERIVEPQALPQSEAVPFGTDVVFSEGSVLVLSDGRRITKLDRTTGAVQWAWEFPMGGSTNRFKNIMTSGDKVIVLSITSALASPTCGHIVLDLEHLVPFSDLSFIESSLKSEYDALLVRRADGEGVASVWAEVGRIRVSTLNADGTLEKTQDFLPGNGRRFKCVIDVGAREQGYVLAEEQSGLISVIKINDKAQIVASFEGSRDSTSDNDVYSSVLDTSDLVFSRIFYNQDKKETVTQTIRINGEDSASNDVAIPFDGSAHGTVLFAAVSSTTPPSVALVSSSGSIQLAREDKTLWVREESLADLAGVTFVDLSEPETEQAVEAMEEESFVNRVVRHVTELRQLPGFIARFIVRFTHASNSAAVRTNPLVLGQLHRDQFGLQKLLIAVTRGGKVFALDSSNSNVVWTRNLGSFANSGPELDVFQVFSTRNASEAGNPQVAVIATRVQDLQSVTVGFHIDAFTGEVRGETDERGLPVGKTLFSGRPVKAFLTPFEHCGTSNRVVAVVNDEAKFVIFPACKKLSSKIQGLGSQLFYTTSETSRTGETVIRGYAPTSFDSNLMFNTVELWSRPFPGQTVVEVNALTPATIASYGRALGDKSVLYKYLNPHVLVVSSVTPEETLGHVYIIDSTTGATVHEVQIGNVVGKAVHAAMVENWLVYSWLEGPGEGGGAGGWRLGSTELYEVGDEQSAGRSSLATIPKLQALTHTFIVPSEMSSLSFTTSKFGVTAKELIFIDGLGQVAALPRRVFDPRRPTHKPTKEDQEEMLLPYDPQIVHEPRGVLSHQYPIVGAKYIESSPSLLESTSLVFAYGLDLFLTRAVQPSGTFDILGDGFNKVQLLVTLAGLAVACFVTAPAVSRKALRAKWY